ncbi:hypothetical protein AB0I92_03820 [Micromonospora chalcea]|uniref:hypothetical protein n=1 Tax=Micromonospora chalcea TaxID=1874 RepID=UPI0033D79BDE
MKPLHDQPHGQWPIQQVPASTDTPVIPPDPPQSSPIRQEAEVAYPEPVGVFAKPFTPNDARPPYQSAQVHGSHSRLYQAGRDVNLTEQKLRWLPLVPIGEEVESCTTAFYPPRRYDEAARIFARSEFGVTVLSGRPGTGRRSSALTLLSDNGAQYVHECLTDWTPIPRTDVLPKEPEGRYLLDLTNEPTEIPEQFGRTLMAYGRVLAELNARMVILVTNKLWQACASDTVSITVELAPPSVRGVLNAHLQAFGDHLKWLDDDATLRGLVDELEVGESGPRRVAELAAIVSRYTPFDEPAVDQIREAFRHWKHYLDRQFAEYRDARGVDAGALQAQQMGAARARALLIAVAVLDGAPSEVVLDACDELLKKLRANPSARDILIGPELQDLIDRIDAELVGDTITITRKSPGLDKAVLERVWQQRPQLRTPIRSWLESITTTGAVANDHLDRVADVLVRLAADLGSLETLDIVQKWLTQKSRHRTLAITILERLAISNEVGSVVRRRLYEWASRKSGVDILTGVAEVCAGQLAHHSVKAALSRLRLLIGHEVIAARPAAAQALRQLAVNDELGDEVVTVVFDWFERQDRRAGALGLLALIDPELEPSTTELIRSIASAPERAQALRDAWSALISDRATGAAAMTVAENWFAAADAGALDPEVVIAILAPIIRNNLTSDSFKDFVTQGSSSETRKNLIVSLVMGSSPSIIDASANKQ